MIRPKRGRLPLSEVYRELYPWNNLNEFVDTIKSTIAYKTEDNSFIALNKPFGVGIYNAHDMNKNKANQDKLLYQLSGAPKYCIRDALQPLADELKSSKPYEVIKSIDRYMSGLILVTNDAQVYAPRVNKAIAAGRSTKTPPYGFRAITYGYPTIGAKKINERVGLQLIEVDELGDYKEPIIVEKPSLKFVHNHNGQMKVFQTELEVKKINREYSVALVELYVSSFKLDFTRCYLSSKTSFILGDVRFSKRIREILGKPIQVSAFKSSHIYDDKYEPLNSKLRNLLGVYKNASIPLMLDLHAIRLKGFDRTQRSKRDLVIQSQLVPVHFALTAERLDLLDGLSGFGHRRDTVADESIK